MKNVNEKVGIEKKFRLITLLLIVVVFFASCGGGGLTAEQLRELEETKEAALSAEKKVQSQKRERIVLNKELTGKKADLKKLLEEKEVLMEKFRKIQEMKIDDTQSDTRNVEGIENGGNN